MPRQDKKNYNKYNLLVVCILLLATNIYIFYLDFSSYNRKLKFAVLDVGQGDALFLESSTGVQILFDGGLPRSLLPKLSKVMPFWDRSIDAIFITNPDQDHIGGFSDLIKYYKVGKVFESGTRSDSKTFENLRGQIAEKNIENVLVKKGMILDIGGGAYVQIIFPDRDVSSFTTNDGSIIAKVIYGNTSILLTGDATEKTEKLVLENNSKRILDSDILKVPHHGSKSSTSFHFVDAVSPEYALISLGKDNKYGHPHQEVLNRFEEFGIKVLRTDEKGTIILKSDGESYDFTFKK